MQLFYFPDLTAEMTTFTFDKEESSHIVKVLRKKEGDLLHITNGKGECWEAEIELSSQKACVVTLTKHRKESGRNYYLHLAVAPTKMNDLI